MKLLRYITIAIIGVTAISCQKSYNPPDLVLDSSNGTGGGGSTTSNGSLLVKVESKTTGSKEATTETYEYDGSDRLTRIVTKETDSSGASVTYYYRYARAASGKVTMIVTNLLAVANPGAGYPDSLFYNVHYPSTGGFDFTSYSISLSGVLFKDSTVYIYNSSGTTITDTYTYQSAAGAPFALAGRQQYVFSGGNIVTLKGYDPSVSTTVPSGTFSFEFDNKPAAINLGTEAFLPGLDAGYSCTNNITKHTLAVPGLNEVLQYSYQYNSTTQRPTSATINQTTAKKTYTVTYTYK